MFLEECKNIFKEKKKMSKCIAETIEIFSNDCDKENSNKKNSADTDEENSDEKYSNKENPDEENFAEKD